MNRCPVAVSGSSTAAPQNGETPQAAGARCTAASPHAHNAIRFPLNSSLDITGGSTGSRTRTIQR
jgi:hypothetical protein